MNSLMSLSLKEKCVSPMGWLWVTYAPASSSPRSKSGYTVSETPLQWYTLPSLVMQNAFSAWLSPAICPVYSFSLDCTTCGLPQSIRSTSFFSSWRAIPSFGFPTEADRPPVFMYRFFHSSNFTFSFRGDKPSLSLNSSLSAFARMVHLQLGCMGGMFTPGTPSLNGNAQPLSSWQISQPPPRKIYSPIPSSL